MDPLGSLESPACAESSAGQIEAEFLNDTHLFCGLSRGISGAGVFVATYETLAPGTAVELELELPNGLVRALGEVRWTRSEREDIDQRPGIGILFMGLAPEAVAILAHALRSGSSRYHEI